jgi:hypothetical protein
VRKQKCDSPALEAVFTLIVPSERLPAISALLIRPPGAWLRSRPVLLDARGAQPSQAMLVDGGLPRQKLVRRQRVSTAGFLEG